jgi:hypothetical protein
VAGKFGHCAGACPTACPAYSATENSTTRWQMQRQITEHIIMPPDIGHPAAECHHRNRPRCDVDHRPWRVVWIRRRKATRRDGLKCRIQFKVSAVLHFRHPAIRSSRRRRWRDRFPARLRNGARRHRRQAPRFGVIALGARQTGSRSRTRTHRLRRGSSSRANVLA